MRDFAYQWKFLEKERDCLDSDYDNPFRTVPFCWEGLSEFKANFVNEFDLGFAVGMLRVSVRLGSIGVALGETTTWHVLAIDAKSDWIVGNKTKKLERRNTSF